MDEIAAGIFHWKARHPRIGMEVSSYLDASSGTLIDPMAPPGGAEAIAAQADVARIVLTNRHHLRDSVALAAELGCPILCHEAGLHEFENRAAVAGFAFGEELAPGVTAREVDAICPEETALHLGAGAGALAVADGVINYGGLRFVPDELLGDDPEAIKRGLLASYRQLAELEFDALLPAHGDPIPSGGRVALREFAARG